MKRVFLMFALAVFFISIVSAVPFSFTTESEVAIIRETSEPAKFHLTITNNGVDDDFLIYPVLGLKSKPDRAVRVNAGQTIEVLFEVSLPSNLQKGFSGFFVFDYSVKSEKNGVLNAKGLINVIPIDEVFDISINPFTPWDSQANIIVYNTHNITLSGIRFDIKSDLFEGVQTSSFAPFESKNLSIVINKEKAAGLEAGTYDAYITASIDNSEVKHRVDLKYLEKSGLSVSREVKGTIIRQTIIEKKNEGNVLTNASIIYERNIITRLLTSLSISPDRVEKKGFSVVYVWERELRPNESLKITAKTNYTLPLLLLIIIIAIVLGVYYFFLTSVGLTKHVSFVRTKGGEFALKVTLRIKSRANAENVMVTDHVPHGMQLYDKFGATPHSIDQSSRKITWNFGRLNAGEERVISYIIYSKVARVGAFTLPIASASFMQNGQHKHVLSNKTSFVSDNITRD